GDALAHHRIAGAAELGGAPQDAVDAGTADPVHAPGAGAAHHLPFTRERGARDPPALARRAHALRVGHAHTVEEHLVEVDLTTEVAQRTHGDAGCVQVNEEVGEALALRHVGVGPRE